jgi:2-dehydropantoate 2-reductase
VTRYVVIGAGAIGALLAARLTLAGIDSVLVARGANLEALRTRGVTIHHPDGTAIVDVSVTGGPEDVELSTGDILVFATKTQDLEGVLTDWARRPLTGGGFGSDLPALTLQNGLAAEDAALRRFRSVYGVSMWIAASYLVPGEVVSPSWPTVGIAWIGASAPAVPVDATAARIAVDWEAAGFLARVVPDIRSVKAHKLLGNLSNALDLFSGDTRELAIAAGELRSEADRVYAAAGIRPVDPGSDALGFASLDFRPVPGQVTGKRSTWQSFARGSTSEVDFLNGEIVLLGRKHGVPTAVNEHVQRALGELALEGGVHPRQLGALLVPTHHSASKGRTS